MRLTVRQLKRIIKEAVSVEKRKQERIGALNMPPEKEEKIARFIEDIYDIGINDFGKNSGTVLISWDKVLRLARKKGIKTTPDELERVFNHSDMLDSGLAYIMGVTDSGFDFVDPFPEGLLQLRSRRTLKESREKF
jgi:hypothetical protein